MTGGKRSAAALPAALALAGCAALAPGSPPHAASAATTPISGRLALQLDAQPGRSAQAFSASFELRGNGDDGELRLSTPLGTTLAVAHWGAGDARLVTPHGEQRFEDLEALSLQAFGEALPLRALPDWLQGRPWPAAAEPARPRSDGPGFEQLGWAIDLARFDSGQWQAWRAAPPAARLRVQLDPR